jgi:hypothetical protein
MRDIFPAHWDGEIRAQVVWHASCWVEQLPRHDPLAVVLVPDNAPLDEPDDDPLDEEGTTQEAWQLAAWELQSIMQLVVVELCASRIDLPGAAASPFVADAQIIDAVRMISRPRTCPSSVTRAGQHNALVAAAKCASRAMRRGRINLRYAVRM